MEYVDVAYSKGAYIKSYEPIVHPINGPDLWPKSGMPAVQAPKKFKLPGRPKKARNREPDEQAKT